MRFVRHVLVACLVLASASVSAAGLFRAYVSSTGNDANDCTLPHPCRLLPRAVSAVASGGEIWMLDSANYNTAQVNVDRSVTILAIPGALGSVVATGGGDAIFIGTAGIKVALRNLVIVRLGSGNDGIGINSAAEVDVEDCEISNMTGSGIAAFDANAKVRVTSTRLRSNHNGIYARGPVMVSLDRVTSVGNVTAGVYADTGSTVIASNTILRNNVYGAYAVSSKLSIDSSQGDANDSAGVYADSHSSVNVSTSWFRHNANGVYASLAGVLVDRTRSDSNATAGLYASDGSSVTVRDSGFANNGSYAVISEATGIFVTQVALVHNTASDAPEGYRVAASSGTEAHLFADGNQCALCGFTFEFANAGGTEKVYTWGNNSAVLGGSVFNGALEPPMPFF